MKESFLPSLHFVLMHECVFAAGHYGDFANVVTEDVPGDAGGCTKFGIDQASNPHLDIRTLTLGDAQQIYHDNEWTRCRCDDLPAGYDSIVFDIAVNNGIGTSIRLLQSALGATVDGLIGPATLALATSSGSTGIRRLLILRQKRYYDIVTTHPTDAKFLKGWLARNNDLSTFVGILPSSLA